jgi:hypothetical protein
MVMTVAMRRDDQLVHPLVPSHRPSFSPMSRPGVMLSLTTPQYDTSERFAAAGRHESRAASLALLCARIRRLPGLRVTDGDRATRFGAGAGTGGPRGPVRVRIDVRETGFSGYELGHRMRRFSGVPLEICEQDAVVAVFDVGDDISARGTRLLFALTHACETLGA